MQNNEKGVMASEFMTRLFKDYGVTHVFYQEAMFRRTIKTLQEQGVEAIRTHSENSVGYFADGYARVSNRPGICFTQSVGAANLTGGVHEAYLGNSPVIALTGKKVPFQRYKNGYQEADHRLFFEAITKFNAELNDPVQLPYLLKQCFREVTTGKPRPAHVDIPNRMGKTTEEAFITEPYSAAPEYSRYPAHRPMADPASVKKAAEAIAEAKTPVIIAGRGAMMSDAGDEIYELAVKADIPVITSPDGKTLIDEKDPIWAGIAGEYGMRCANKTLERCDLVIFIGTTAGDQLTFDWDYPVPTTKAVQIDIEGYELGRNYTDTIGVLGDAKTAVKQLTEAVDEMKHTEWREEVAGYLKENEDFFAISMSSDDLPIRPERLIAELNSVLPDDAVIVADTGYQAIWTATLLRLKKTQHYMRAAGSLGWAFPAALGAKCGAPERPVVCFTGDGGLYYHLSEFETAARYGINTVTVLNNNTGYAQCSPAMRKVYNNAPERFKEHIEFVPTNFTVIAQNMGCWAKRVEKVEDIVPAIKEALASGKPALVEVMTDLNAYTHTDINVYQAIE